jgi:hypothetical protein
MEQFVRDARIAQIYEGTNGIQAMDLVGRKLAKDGGRGVRLFFETVARDIADARAAGDPAGLAGPLEAALGQLQAATMWLAQNGIANPDNAGAGAYPYMQLMGMVALGWMWLKMAAVSDRMKEDPAEDRAFHETKLATARFYASRELVGAEALRRRSRPAQRASWPCPSKRSDYSPTAFPTYQGLSMATSLPFSRRGARRDRSNGSLNCMPKRVA